MKKLFLAVITAASLASCATFGENVSYSCAGLTTALEVLTEARRADKLSDSTIRRVDAAVDTIDPYCGSATRPTMTSSALTAFDQARNVILSELDNVETE